VDIGAFQTQNTAVAVGPATATYSPNSQTITLTATVTDNGQTMPQAAGAVTFTVVVPGGTNMTTGPVALNGQGVATTLLTLPAGFLAGNYTLSANYSDGSGLFGPSSGSGTLTVQAAATTTTLAALPALFVQAVPQIVTLSAHVAAGGAAVPEGAVVFTVGNLAPVTASVDANGNASASVTLPARFAGGAYTVAALYADGRNPNNALNFASSSDTGTLTIR
jgi:hypothetical protein